MMLRLPKNTLMFLFVVAKRIQKVMVISISPFQRTTTIQLSVIEMYINAVALKREDIFKIAIRNRNHFLAKQWAATLLVLCQS